MGACKKVLSTVLLTVLLISCFPLMVDATVLFSDGQEGSSQEVNQNFDAWDTTYTTQGSIVASDMSNPFSGSYNFKVNVPAGQAAGGWTTAYTSNISGTELWVRIENWKCDVLPEDNTEFYYIDGFFQTVAGNTVVRFGLYNDAGSVKWVIRGISTATTFTNYYGNASAAINTNYAIEFHVKQGSGDGAYDLWVDEVKEIEVTGVDNDARTMTYMMIGQAGGSTPDLSELNIYFDDVTVADAPIGPPVTPVEESISIELNAPLNGSTVSAYACNFNYTPTLLGSDSFQNASLIVNGSLVASNQTALVNATVNTISYTLPSNGTYLWNVQVFNSTVSVFASENFTLTVGVYVPPEPTPSPTVSPSVDPDAFTADDAVGVAVALAVMFFGCCVGLIFAVRKREDD